MEWSLMDVESELISLLQKDHIPQHQEFIWEDLPSKFIFKIEILLMI